MRYTAVFASPLLALGLVMGGAPARAEPHQHGVSELLMALDGEELTLELRAPGADIVGFEHTPETAAQEQRHAAVLAILKSVDKMFGLNKEARCHEEKVQVLAHLETKHDGDEKHEDEDHKKEQHDEEMHGEFRVRYFYRCERPSELNRFEMLAYQSLTALRKVELRIVGPNGQTAMQLTPDNRVVDPRP